ncbi:MAG TPA: 3D-(3,5/4)-trihydroxycyclohexane-1,2-dione acylhydrolase (decyclizing) [Vicinamibacterales bacterium]|nr:3D-(3,5/4)-trihydroxycyclohexane-1,2-dione acylhydrolase (decyclizing) [Vicinamibacterales bacterium]
MMRLTMAQALVRYLSAQFSERDGRQQRFFAGMFGIFGHGNVAGIGQALDQLGPGTMRYYQCRNEQAMVHTAAAFAKMSNRLRTLACTSSIGPGASNMITGAAGATINRLPVLLLPGDIFANRAPAPVLQQLESAATQDISVNDCFKPVSRYWDRIYRPEQLLTALPEAMRVLTSPAETGAVTLALPQDTQTEAFDYPASFFEPNIWSVPRQRGDLAAIRLAAKALRTSQRPLIIAGGGVLYSEATEALRRFAEQTCIPVAETQAGKSSMPWDHSLAMGAVGVTGTLAANRLARQADVVLAIGTRLADFTTMSNSLFHPDVQMIAINVCEMDAHKRGALAIVGDARATLDELADAVTGFETSAGYREVFGEWRTEWNAEVDRLYAQRTGPVFAQAELIGAVNACASPEDVVVCAAGSLPGDLHKLWRSREPNTYHLEYGYSCMGYEIAGGLGVKMADPGRDVFVMVGDGSYLMMAQEIVTSIQEGCKLIIILLDSSGYASIGGLSRSVGSDGFGTQFDYKVPVDLAANAASLGAIVHRPTDRAGFDAALKSARDADRTTVIYAKVDAVKGVPGYESWWDVPVAEVSDQPGVQAARERWQAAVDQRRRV